MKKNIIIFIPSVNVGGVEKNFFLITNYLAKKLNKISVITINKNIKKKLNQKVKLITPKKDRWVNSTRYIKYFISLILLIRSLIENRNQIIFSFQANWYAIIIAKLFNIKIITRSNTAPQGWSNNIIKKKIYKYIIKSADEVIVNSNEFKNSLKKYFNVNSTCIYNPLDKSKLSSYNFKRTVTKNSKKKILKLINIGRFTNQKNQILLLKSINYLKGKIPIKLLIIGWGENYLLLKEFIKKNHLDEYVTLKNNVHNPYKYLTKSDVFILSSNYEGLPNVLLEAQFFQKIILSTKCPTGPKEILLNGKAGIFFKMNDYKDLSKKIFYVYNNKNKLKKLTKIGFKNLYRFDQQKNLEKYLKVLLKFL